MFFFKVSVRVSFKVSLGLQLGSFLCFSRVLFRVTLN